MFDGDSASSEGHVVFVWSPSGYSLRDGEGAPPAIGTELENGGVTIVVTKIGVSPLPGDRRPCAFTTGTH